MKPTIEDTKTNAYINPNKVKATQPDLIAELLLAGILYSIVPWGQTTQDGQRDYYSGVITELAYH